MISLIIADHIIPLLLLLPTLTSMMIHNRLPKAPAGSAIAQLSVQSSTAMRGLIDHYRRATDRVCFEDYIDRKRTINDLPTLLRVCLESFGNTFLVIDAHDECGTRDTLFDPTGQTVSLEPNKLNILVRKPTLRTASMI